MFVKKFLFLILLLVTLKSYCQKPALDTTILNNWSAVQGNPVISSDGKYVAYSVQEEATEKYKTVIQSSDHTWRKELLMVSSGRVRFSADSRYVYVQDNRDTLTLLKLGTEQIIWKRAIISFNVFTSGKQAFLVFTEKTKETGQVLTISNSRYGQEKNLGHVNDYYFLPHINNLVLFKAGENNQGSAVELYDLKKGSTANIWTGDSIARFAVDQNASAIAFWGNTADEWSLYFFKQGMPEADRLFNASDEQLSVDFNSSPMISRNGKQVYFNLKERNPGHPHIATKTDAIGVNVWDYRESALHETVSNDPSKYISLVSIATKKVTRLEEGELRIRFEGNVFPDSYVIMHGQTSSDFWWCDSARPSAWLVATHTGEKKLLAGRLPYQLYSYAMDYQLSPVEKYVVNYDPMVKNYFSYDIKTGVKKNLTVNSHVEWEKESNGDYASPQYSEPGGIAAWMKDDKNFIAYDDKSDLWMIDPSGKAVPWCITKGFAKQHHVELKIAKASYDNAVTIVNNSAELLLSAFDTKTKWSGFYTLNLSEGKPKLLGMGPYKYGTPIKASNSHSWVVMRESGAESPNVYYSKDLKTFSRISDVEPEKKCKWFTTSLEAWKLPNGKTAQGVLYKPEDFDSTKKYPVILTYYSLRSDEIYYFKRPHLTRGPINIPWFVSHGYLVFEPDIHYEEERVPGQDALDAVTSAALYLSKYSWVDKNRIGINGHSFGGGETNYIITHTGIFAAAAEGAGPCDAISSYGVMMMGGGNRQWLFEMGQERIKHTLCERPDLYLESSSVLKANQVTTPLLMMHNKEDAAVPWTQGLEFFNSLRRLGKRVWWLMYDGEGHEVWDTGPKMYDYTIRLEQFFDHYLKNKPAPSWMTKGIPLRDKGIYYGYELDSASAEPAEQKVLYKGKMQLVRDAEK